MAALGHRVELCVQSEWTAAAILAAHGRPPLATLRLRVLPLGGTAAAVLYRAAFLSWVARTGGSGLVLARSVRHAAWALGWAHGRFRLVFEAHGVPPLWTPAGPRPDEMPALQRVLDGAVGVVANAPGTLAALRQVGLRLPPALVAHNAGRPAPRPHAGSGIACVGSVRPYKDPETVAHAAGRSPEPITWVGPSAGELAPLIALSGGALRHASAWDPGDVSRRLSRYRALLLPLSHGPFGDALTSPLKLWDALPSGIPLVAADTAAVRAAAKGGFVPYRPGDPEDLVRALRIACTNAAVRQRVVTVARARARTWEQRAAEIAAFAGQVTA